MRLARRLRKAFRPARGEGGFSIAEVLVAGMLLALISLPMMQMFGTSFGLTRITDDMNKVQVCVRHFTEVTRALPFYAPYVSSIGNRDVDDFYWGDARGLANTWATAPEVPVRGYGANPYPQFRVTVKMVYLNDDTSEATMRSGWGPKLSDHDDPVDSTNKTINMIKFQVKAYWMVGGAETASSNHYITSILTRSQVQANLGVTAVQVEVGKRGTTDSSAPHVYKSVNLTITAFGFKGGCTATMLMPASSDITVKGLNFVDQGTLTGYVDLASDGTAGKPWSPRAEPGGWAVKVSVGSAFAVLNDGLIVEFPKPVLTAINPASGPNTNTDMTITVTGDPILSLAAAGGYNNCRAVMRLVWRNADGSEDRSRIIDEIAGTAVVSGNGYTAGADQIADHFDLTDGSAWGACPQTYYAEVWNCKDYTQVGQVGDVAGTSRLAAPVFTFTVNELAPEPTQVYQTGVPARNWGFSNSNYNLTIKGNYFDTAGVTVYIGRGGTPPGAPSVQGTGVNVSDTNTITANFNMAGMAGNEGDCWVYVRNNASGTSGNRANVYQVRRRPATNSITNTDTKGYKYNYYDIAVQLDGTDFYAGYQIYYQNSGGGTTYQVGVGDGEGAPGFSSSTRMTGYLNLIGVTNGTYKVWVADPYESANAANTTFASAYGAPVLLTSAAPYTPTSVWVRFRYKSWWNIWSGRKDSNEAAAARAWATCWEDRGWPGADRAVEVKFQVQGMGFLDAGTGSNTKLNIAAGGNNGNYAASISRAGKTVIIQTSNWENDGTFTWTMPSEGARAYNLVLTNNNGSGSTTYTNRWESKDSEP